ncbi:M15 family metallopeptidase [Promicromonospora iranensis]|uniref:M15 family metallopeptidase n=1 Tax=Promicromonospora iranensis TaxID=1105144 RepID=UPI0023A9EB03|nr:M15 family metallopeptidase [Promicromonospora iranensis]
MVRQQLTQPPAHVSAPRAPWRDRRPMAVAIVGVTVLAAVFGVYPLLDRADSPVIQAVDDALDPGASSSGATGVEGGEIPDGVATLDDDLPAITGLDPALADAVRQAAADAAADDIDFWITSGWRSAAYQQQLLDAAVRKHGSLEAARRVVATPETSRHIGGKAVDIGPTEADYWLIQHGAEYGLCQVYANEIWHFELLTEPGGTCPPMLEDSAG